MMPKLPMKRLLIAVCMIGFGCDSGGICDEATLRDALADSSSGDVVELGSCTLETEVTVPAGVILRGAGPGASVLQSSSGVAITVATSPGSPVVLQGMTIRSGGCAAVVARGDGEFEASDLVVEAEQGIGIAAEGLERFAMRDVIVQGTITPGVSPSSIPLPPYACTEGTPASHGIVAVRIDDLSFDEVSTFGFAAFGALLVESTSVWNGGANSDHIGAGLEVVGGQAELVDLELCGARQDLAPIESFNGVFVAGANIISERLRVCDGEVFGLFHASSAGSHTDLVAESNGFAGVWSQDSLSLDLQGAGTTLRSNGFAGVATFSVDEVSVADAMIAETRPGLIPMGDGAIRAADGIHLVGSASTTVARVQLVDNERIGAVIDLAGGSTTSVSLEAVSVEAEGAGVLGMVAQNGTIEAGWDTDVSRAADVARNDAEFAGALDIAGAVGPSCFPVVDSVVTGGVDALLR